MRMKRMGRIRRPFYRIGAMDKRSPRDGRVIEALGWFDPITTDPEKTINLKAGRIHYWLSVGQNPKTPHHSKLFQLLFKIKDEFPPSINGLCL
ncbi:MAG: 30S ribosomal protein S16, partial [Planctomycetia bacterium]|nr:30S ribosomal protein S16 [Planctomycetia bacterium]